MKIRTLLVDDEPLARERLRTLLAREPDVEVAGECGDGASAIAAIEEHEPDLVFLDVQMPEADGFEVVRAVGPERMPPVIFVTAFDQYALRAFDVHACDYLLKPFDRQRFAAALQRARGRLREKRSATPDLRALLEELRPAPRFAGRLVIRDGGRVLFLGTDEIDWIGAAGNYVEIHAGKQVHLLRETMHALEGRLDPGCFLRIHRSTIVRVDCIRELYADFHGDYSVRLRDGTRLTLSRTHKDRLKKLLDQEF